MDQNAIPHADVINNLIQEFNKLPGIGPKSAQRIVFYLLRSGDEQSKLLAEAILFLKRKITLCSTCCNVTESDPCAICRSDKRDHSQICIVEQPQDILALEHTGIYQGMYHVLHGAISPTEGVGTEDIRVRARRKLRMVHNARNINDLRVPPANHLEVLRGDRRGQHSIRINRQWRVCFRWEDGDAHDVEIVDYHRS